MNYYGPKEIAASYRTVRGNTIVIAEEIPEEHYGFSVTPDTRTVGQLLIHMATAPRMALLIHQVEHLDTLEGFDFMSFFGILKAEEQTPRGKEEIVRLLREEGERFAGWIETVSEDFLAETVTYPAGMIPPTKTRFEMLLSPKEHEMHHRGQLMVMQRLIGVVPHMTRAMEARIAQMQATQASA